MEYTKKFLKYTLLGLLSVIMAAGFIVGVIFALIAILGTCLETVAYILLIIPALCSAFLGFVCLDGLKVLTDKWHIE